MMTDEQKARILQLHAMGMGYAAIGKEMGIKRDTIKSFISRNKNALPTTRCDFCGRKIVQIPKQKPKRFCSDQCRMRWWSSHQEEINRKAYHTFTCNYCGKEFTVYGKKDAKYCSVECYGKARARAYEASRQKLKENAVSCGAALQDLPAGCVCASCRWFVNGKRSCPCKERAEKDV